MSIVSKFINKVLPGSPTEKLTKATFDKWIKPEDKDMVENIATMVAMPYGVAAIGNALGVGAQAASVIGKGIGAWANQQDPIMAMVQQSLSNPITAKNFNFSELKDQAGNFIKDAPEKIVDMVKKSPQLLVKLLGGGQAGSEKMDVGNLQKLLDGMGIGGVNLGDVVNKMGLGGAATGAGNGILEKLGLSGNNKDIAEQILAVMGLSAAANKLSTKEQNQQEELLGAAKSGLTNQKDLAEKMIPTEANRQSEFGKSKDEISRQYAAAGQTLLNSLASTGGLKRDIGAGQMRRVADDEAKAKLEVLRGIDLAAPGKTAAALSALSGVSGQQGQLGKYWGDQAQAIQKGVFDTAASLYAANKKSSADKYYDWMLQQGMNGQGYPGGAPASNPAETAQGASTNNASDALQTATDLLKGKWKTPETNTPAIPGVPVYNPNGEQVPANYGPGSTITQNQTQGIPASVPDNAPWVQQGTGNNNVNWGSIVDDFMKKLPDFNRQKSIFG